MEPLTLTPDDEHNRRLVSRVHPGDWGNPQPADRYDLVVIGAGTAGLVTAAGAAGVGAKVALVERHLLGGDCLNYGCVPSKALIHAARAAAAVREATKLGIDSPAAGSVDFSAVMERMRRLRGDIARHDSAERFQQLGVDVFLGDGEFIDAGTSVRVGEARLRFRKAVICTGARAAAPAIPGLDAAGYLTNESLFSLTVLPRRMAVIGGGPIGCEMSQAFARFGSQVTLLETGSRILRRDDPEAAARVSMAIAADGVRIRLNAAVSGVERTADGKRLKVTTDGREEALIVDDILVAVGRAPNVEGLNLESAGVEWDRSGVRVDDRLRTTNRRIFAAGDVCFPAKFTHAADYLARTVVRNALFFGRGRASRLLIPWCTYTSPELAHVGMTAEEASARGLAIDTFTQELADVDRAVLDDETEGFVRVHVRRGTDAIVGATIVAAHAGELISELTLAMQHGVGLRRIGATIHPYPTQADAIRKLGDQYNRTRLTPFTRWLLRTVLRFA
jgi:pyruvate/2-oxoglutarate dehydrogenase complex dihydrolipoamide dehydrogenase (E3) component